jgi:arginine decarboxylase
MYGPLFAIARKKRGSARVSSARDVTFSLAFTRVAGRVTKEFANGAPAARQNGMGGEKEERMTKRVTMAAATAGHAEGGTPLNAFDNALLVAGIGNINLIKVSSIVPPEVALIELPKIKPGALVPTAYAAMTSETPGETIAAAVGYALPDDPARNGVIMEFHGVATQAEAERAIVAMLEESFRVRGETIREKRVYAVEHTVKRIGCAVAAVALLSDDDLV